MEKNNDLPDFIKKIILIIIGAIIVAIVFPSLLKIPCVINFFKSESRELFIVMAAIMIGLLVFAWERIGLYWERYRETKKTGKFPLISIDYIFIYIIEVAICAFLKELETSKEFKFFGGFFLIILVILFFRWPVPFFKGFLNFLQIVFFQKKASKNDNETRITLDEPIKSKSQDKLRRKKFVTDLSKLILELPTELTGSFTIGLNGSWGEGKTSVIKLLIEKLEADSKFEENFLLIQFDPWHFEDEKAILNAFYDQLEKAFSTKFIFTGIKKSIARYLKFISTGVSLSGIKFDIHSPAITIKNTKEQIENYIQKVGKKVLIIIDDIDRLQPDEMALIFKLVRQNSNFKNTIFLLSFDELIVKKVLEDKINIGGDFLEKIINLPMHLPTIEQQTIDHYLLEEIKQLLETLKIPDDEIIQLFEESQNIYKSSVSSLFKTLRVTKRYLNSLKSTLDSIKSEVNPGDYIILEIIKVFNYGIYEKIGKNQDIFAPTSLDQLSLSFNEKINRKKNPFDLIPSIPDLYTFLFENTKAEQKEIFDTLLKALFPWTYGKKSSGQNYDFSNMGKDRDKKLISHPDCFPKYFLLQVPMLEIPDETVEKMISKWDSLQTEGPKAAIKQEMFKTGQEGLTTSKLLEKLMDFNKKISLPLALSIIEVIYENAGAFQRVDQNRFNRWSSEFSKAAWLMDYLINNGIDKPLKAKVLEDAVTKTPDLLFSSFIISIYNEDKEPMSDRDFIALKPLKEKVSQRIQYFIDNKNDIFEKYPAGWSFILYRLGTDWGEREVQFSEIIQDYVFSLVKDNIQKFYKLLYDMTYEPSLPFNQEFNFDQFKKFFDLIKFKEIALKFKDNQSLSKEERKIISKFLEYIQEQPQLS